MAEFVDMRTSPTSELRHAVVEGKPVWLYGREYRPARRPVRWVAARWLHRLAERVAP